MPSLIQAAITYCNLGWHVLPVNGKVPAAGDGWPDIDLVAFFDKLPATGMVAR